MSLEIIHGDCLEVLPTLAAGSVDCVVTDPPYGMPSYEPPSWHQGNRGTCTDVTEQAWDAFSTNWVGGAVRALSDDGSMLAFCKVEDAGRLRDAMHLHGVAPRHVLAWVKTTPIPRGCRPTYQSAFECIVWGARPGAWFDRPPDGRDRWNVIEGPMVRSNTERTGHPTQKPEWLMERILRRHCPPGGTVLDPFLGSGTTLVAAAKLGLNGIGIEREAEYVEIARKRVARATEQLRLEGST